MLFLFECLKCEKRRGVFDDGSEYVSNGVKLSKAEMDEWEKEDDQGNDRKEKDKELLKRYRSEFCLSEKEGGYYSDLYDLMTIRECLRIGEYWKKRLKIKGGWVGNELKKRRLFC